MTKIILLIAFSVSTLIAISQKNSSDTSLHSLIKLDLGGQGIGFSFEPVPGKAFTLELSAGIGGGYDISEENISYKWSNSQNAFYFEATPKFYYNRQKRLEKGKKLYNNAGNYIGVRLRYTTDGLSDKIFTRKARLINIHWGLQRPVGNRWTFNMHLGAGYATDVHSGFGTIYPALDFKFSYLLKR